MVKWLDMGFDTVDLGQPDGFRVCQCLQCKALFDTGEDWSEKLWILHRKLAERVLKSHPNKQVTLMSYILTGAPALPVATPHAIAAKRAAITPCV